MKAYFFFHNEFETLQDLEDEDGFIEVHLDLTIISMMQLDDMVTYNIRNYKGEEIELHLLVNSRMFDFVKNELSIQCQIGTPLEDNGSDFGFGHSLN